MGIVRLPDELKGSIERQVAKGRVAPQAGLTQPPGH